MGMKTFGKQMFWSTIYTVTPLVVLLSGAKWAAILSGDFVYLQL
jgi:hypothetical protein